MRLLGQPLREPACKVIPVGACHGGSPLWSGNRRAACATGAFCLRAQAFSWKKKATACTVGSSKAQGERREANCP